MAAQRVARDEKFAAPAAPNTLPAEPAPNAVPMSAPRPCCRSTRPITDSAEITCTACSNGYNHSIEKLRHRLRGRSEEHTSELQSRGHLLCRLLLKKKKYDTVNTSNAH